MIDSRRVECLWLHENNEGTLQRPNSRFAVESCLWRDISGTQKMPGPFQ
jgi:hypothetical protein